jgi:uncharacterized protein YbaR (Trm112 family)
MDPAVLTLLRCPVTRQKLRLVAAAEAATLGLEAQDVLLREDGRVYYRFDAHGFPFLLPDSGVAVPAGVAAAGQPAGTGPHPDGN